MITGRFDRGTAALVGAVAAWSAVTIASPFLPLVDLPQHVAAARLLLAIDRPELGALYEATLFPQVNVLGLLVSAPLLAVLPEGAAVRLLLVLSFAMLGWSLHRVARTCGAPAWSAAFAMLFAFHFNWMYGFLSFNLGIPLLLVLLARWAAALDVPREARPRSRDLGIEAALAFAIVLAHTLLLAFAVAALVVWLGFVWRRRVGSAPRALAILPAVLWAALCMVRARSAPAPGSGGLEALWEGPATKLAEFGRALVVASTSGRIEWLVLIGAALVAGALLVAERRLVEAPREPAAGPRYLRSVALLAVLAYVLLPYSIYDRSAVTHGVFILYSRFLALAPLAFLPTLSWPRGGHLRTGLAVGVVALVLVLAVHRFVLFRGAGAQALGLDEAIAAIPSGKILKSLIYEPQPAGLRFEAFLHVASYYQARALGETDQSFALLPESPVHYRDPNRPYLSRADEHLRPDQFDDTRATMYDAILVHDRGGQWMTATTAPWPVAFQQNGWMVLRKP